jgi:dTDP-4-amino-4,6-dideoxygalactose transaminase
MAAGDCPNAERLAGELFTLLVHPTVETADLDDVVEAIGKVTAGLKQTAK